MARTGGELPVPAGTITELTNADVSGDITFQHIGGAPARLIGTTDATTPSVPDFDGGFVYRFTQGELGVTLADMFPGASYVRLWAYTPTGAVFSVYHA